MNTAIRNAVRAAIKEKGISQNAFAVEIGLRREHLSRMLSGGVSQMPANWGKVLDAAGLELTVQPKKGRRRKP